MLKQYKDSSESIKLNNTELQWLVVPEYTREHGALKCVNKFCIYIYNLYTDICICIPNHITDLPVSLSRWYRPTGVMFCRAETGVDRYQYNYKSDHATGPAGKGGQVWETRLVEFLFTILSLEANGR